MNVNKIKIWIFRVIVPVLMIFFLVGCRGAREQNGVVELTFWHAWGGYEGKALERLVDEFNQTHPHIRVKPSYFLIGDKLLAAIAGGVPPDIATVWEWMLVSMGESGCFLPLEDRMREAGFTKEAYLPGIWEYGVFGEHHWGVPTTLNCMAIYYNKTLARQAGLDPEHPPTTIKELEHWAETLNVFDNAGRIKRIGFVPSIAIIWFWNFGGRIYDPATRTMTFDQPGNIRALEWMNKMYQRVGLDNWRRFQAGFGAYQSPQNPFFTGKLALKEDGQWLIMFIKQFAPELDYGIFAYPDAVKGGAGYTSVSGSFWVIPVGTRHPEEAWEFLRWLISPEQSARFAAALYNIPPLRATLERPEFKKIVDEKFQFFINQLLEGRARFYPPLPITQILVEKLNQRVEMVFANRITPEKALKTLDKELQSELNRSLKFLGIK
ncbi:ABC transporter substrate-binding protein [Candidatus Sumerlaeota bacterium]|nr:ABC transporter substrate-binding protein [Candidatus Sumerlaeota bacterium]